MTRGAASTGWGSASRVLCVRLDALGDVLMTTPAIRALKASTRGRRVTLLTSSGAAPVSRMVPEIDETLAYDPPWMKASAALGDAAADRAMVERLRAARFDAAVVFTVYSQNPLPAALLCYLADIPLRLAHCRENPYQLLTDWVREPEPAERVRHEVRRQLDLVSAVGAAPRDERLSLAVPPGARARVRKRLLAARVDPDDRFIVIHPGSSAPSRRYPPDSFAVVARRLEAEAGCRVVLTGSEGERELVEGIRAAAGGAAVSLAGRLALDEMAALLSLAPLLVSNNTGPVHMAAALGTPVVDLYALTNPQHTPWRVPSRVLYHDVPCRYCYKSVCPEQHHRCLRGVAPEDVVRAALELLDEGRDAPGVEGPVLPHVATAPPRLPPPLPTPGGQA